MKTLIWQNYYLKDQKAGIDPHFLPWDNTLNLRPEWREYWTFRQIREQGLLNSPGLYGIFSWKFKNKMKLDGNQVLDFIQKNPGADIYIFNPFVNEALLYPNVWLQGEKFHPGFIELTEKLFSEAGMAFDLDSFVSNPRHDVYCNFWVASERVWNLYFELAEKIFFHVEAMEDNPLKRKLFSRADEKIDSGYLPFILERLISIVIENNPALKVINYHHTDEQLVKNAACSVMLAQQALSLHDELRASKKAPQDEPWVSYRKQHKEELRSKNRIQPKSYLQKIIELFKT